MVENNDSGGIQIKATNRKALRDYVIEEKMEAGMVLLGSEIKSIRSGRANLRDSYAAFEGNEVFVFGMHISPYAQASYFGHEPTRPRKLLLHRDEIKRLIGKIAQKGYTLVPLKLYIKGGKAKLEIGLAHGRRKYDKRRQIAEREAEREISRAVRYRRSAAKK
jgi:SsrA-binding protein